MQLMLDTEVKVFHESISYFMKWPETVFHEMPWKKNFTIYPSLKSNFPCRTPMVAASGPKKVQLNCVAIKISYMYVN